MASSFLDPALATTLKSSSIIATLWSNYGHVYRLRFIIPVPFPAARVPTTTTTTSCILKVLQPPASLTSTEDESNLRKLLSYRVERYFYTQVLANRPPLPAATNIAAAAAPATTLLPSAVDSCLLLEDLDARGFLVAAPGYLDLRMTRAVLKWLAGFHGTFMGAAVAEGLPSVPPPLQASVNSGSGKAEGGQGVWEQGGYWYLDTRSDEYTAMCEDDVESAFLQPWVAPVAARLKDVAQPGRTLLHGDLKAANIVFARDDDDACYKCACYDFQYVGKGLGAVDLVYLLATSVERRVVGDGALVRELLGTYHAEVVALAGDRAEGWTWEVMLRQMDLAIVDWYRFMMGWGEWGNGVFVTEAKVKAIIDSWQKNGMQS